MVEEQKTEEVQHSLTDRATTEAWLTEKQIPFHSVEHEAVMTMADMDEKVHFEGEYQGTMFAKNLFYCDKKNKARMWVVCCANSTQIDLKALTKTLGCGSGNLRAGSEEAMLGKLGAKKGALTLFSIINDTTKEVNLVIDKKLTEEFPYIGFHPMDNTATTAITKEAMMQVIEISQHEAQILDFAALAPAAPAGGAAAPKQKPQKQPKAPQNQGEEGGKKGRGKNKKGGQQAAAEGAPAAGGAAGAGGAAADADVRGITYGKEQNFSQWYSQVITKSELIEYYDISGCYILRPASFFIWEQIQQFADAKFKQHGVQNVYFPMFVTEAALNKEKNHVAGFTPEVAWVTKSGQSEMPEPIAIRPTSETIMYPSFAKWIRSHRDLPLLTNQWTNVVRWEFKHPTPFIRTREFLWQEGHTAHSSTEEAAEFQHKMQEVYALIYEELLAAPVVRGRKSEDERFAGAIDTATVELYVPVSGRGIQGATSHHLGQNFSKMFEVMYEDVDSERKFVHQTSWGISTRSIGAMIMIHSDNKGLVLPPKVAQTQFVIIPIRKKQDDQQLLSSKAHEIAAQLREAGLRVAVDDSDTHNPGYKFNEWEMKGTPVRLELGMRDIEATECKVVVRHSGVKFQAKWDSLATAMTTLLEEIHTQMYQKATVARDEHLKTVANWDDFMAALNNRDICLADWCDEKECEERIKDQSKEESMKAMEEMNEDEALLTGSAKTLCIPYQMGKQASGEEAPFENVCCFFCQAPAKVTALWGRSY